MRADRGALDYRQGRAQIDHVPEVANSRASSELAQGFRSRQVLVEKKLLLHGVRRSRSRPTWPAPVDIARKAQTPLPVSARRAGS